MQYASNNASFVLNNANDKLRIILFAVAYRDLVDYSNQFHEMFISSCTVCFWRDQLTERFFQRSVLPESSCLHYLLPDKSEPSVTDRLLHPRNFETSYSIDFMCNWQCTLIQPLAAIWNTPLHSLQYNSVGSHDRAFLIWRTPTGSSKLPCRCTFWRETWPRVQAIYGAGAPSLWIRLVIENLRRHFQMTN